jgi:hypothetical protein
MSEFQCSKCGSNKITYEPINTNSLNNLVNKIIKLITLGKSNKFKIGSYLCICKECGHKNIIQVN